ncbi:NAD(P)-binding protein [Halobacillus rhizosphaerae]|uniref:NAD(P)-binding protein n=1 Tax=Halobacillus rhizosphaerae TaxID=3064889 RepID=UPI00398BB73F
MKTAIIGAGLSGLACALTLEKYGHQAEIFEKRQMVGDRFVIAEAMFSMLHTPIDDEIRYLSDTHGIHLTPSSNIQKVFCYSKNESACLDGSIGFTNMRGKHPDSYEKQLAAQLNSTIHYNHNVRYDDVKNDYTHVILATGDALDTTQFQPYDVAYKASFKGAVLAGEFNPTEAHTFFNNDFAPKGMAYLLPHSQSEASLVLAYPQYSENEDLDKEELWKMCYEECSKILDQDFKIMHEYSIKDYRIGKIEHARIGNTFFVGNCWGAITPVFGFGQFESILTGIYAAQDIAGYGDYQKLVEPLSQGYHDSLSLRRTIEKFDNHKLDLIIKSLNNKALEGIITNKNINFFKLISRLVHPFSRHA